ncbi:MAG: hypothetical protein ACKPKO_26335, partial [Candidatus Fonsibacter sp.]
MSENLPYKNLKFEDNVHLHEILKKTPDDYYKGYIVEVNLHFPIELHDKFKEFPPAPESLTPNIDWFSSFQKDVGVNNGIITKKINIMDQNKIGPHLYNHYNYVIH